MRWDDMTPEAQAAHMEYVRSEQGMKDQMEHWEKLEAICAKVTPEMAAERDLQEIVWAADDVIRFRENTMVTTLQEHGPSAVTKGIGDWEGKQLFINWPKGWELDQFKKLLREGNGIVLWLLQNGPADMNRLGDQGMLEMHGRGFSQKDKEQFVMLIGYSVSGGGGLSYFSPAMCQRGDEIADKMREERDE